jgi:spermidine synthase
VPRRRLTIALLYALFFFSGSAGLGYQAVWAKMFAPGLGHEMPAVLAVVCAFLGGMALGAWTLDGVVSRSVQPGRWYALLELVIGLWGLTSTLLIPLTNQAALRMVGLQPTPIWHWAIAFALPFLSLLPATAAMGATLPAMDRFLAPLTAGCRCVGGLYATNTLGAVIGTLAGTFILMPALGLRKATWSLAGLNLLCGAVAWWTASRVHGRREAAEAIDSSGGQISAHPTTGAPTSRFSRLRLATTVFCTGLLGIGFEVAGVRVLSQVLENTVYSFAAVLAVYLLGTSAGSAAYQRWGRRTDSRSLLADLLCVTAVGCLVAVVALAKAPALYTTCRSALGDSRFAVLTAEMAAAATVFTLPTATMGAMFSHLAQSARKSEGGIGWAFAVNTAGGSLAGLVFGVLLLPAAGSKWTLVLIALGYLLLVPCLAGWRWASALIPLGLLPFLPRDLRVVDVPQDGRLLDYREGVMASVAVVEDGAGRRTLRVNNRFQMGGTGAAAAEYLQADIPLLLHLAPKRALFLGAGTGITLGAAALHPNLNSDGVELLPEVVQVMPRFEPENQAPTQNPRLKVATADARRFVQANVEEYDVIVGDLFHPARDGAGALYTVEHFRAIRDRLGPGGLFCQWLPLHQLDEPTLRVIARTFLEVFPDATAWLLRFNVDAPVLGLIGAQAPLRYSEHWLEDRVENPALAEHLKTLALADSIRLFGNLVAGPSQLRVWAGDAALNTDDHPRVAFGAPRFSFRKDAPTYGRLEAVLRLGPPDLRSSLGLTADAASEARGRRLGAYIAARDVYLRGLIAEANGHSTQAVDAFIESARLSEDFTAGYARCLSLASVLATSQPPQARALLERLVQAQPARPVAKEMMQRLFSDGVR